MTMMTVLLLVPVVFSFAVGTAFEEETFTEEPRTNVIGVLSEKVGLPCDITSNMTGDEVSLVLWYKDDSTTPIYSCDARKTSLMNAHHSPADELGHRAYFRTEAVPSVLELYPVRQEDEGLYRCRVDFKKARTKNFEIVLKVILPPNEPIITDQNGEILQSKSIIGPYNEGDRLLLVCQVEGGSPPPVVTWWRESFLLDDQYNVTAQGVSRNELEIKSLGRNDLMATFNCLATNNNISFPVQSSVTVELNFKPRSVWIEGNPRPLSAGKAVTLKCRSEGSRPAATIEWYKSGIKMNSTQNNSSSTLTFVPLSEDSGQDLSCRAENHLIPSSAINDSWKLDVHYVPKLNLRLGSHLRHQHIQEGSDVFFDCDIRASPPVKEIGWRFEGRDVQTNTSAGIIVSNQSLVLQKVTRNHRGKYTCTATNKEGKGESSPFFLKVKYAPVCKPGQKTVYGAARQEAVRVSCELDADPADVTYKWRFNNSLEELDSSNVEINSVRSLATIVPQSEADYGALLCWGKNSIGIQRNPCVFTLIPAGPPDPVQNCSVTNQTEDSLTVACSEGYDGGLPQIFHMELQDTVYRQVRANVSDQSPVLVAMGLTPGTSFIIAVYASNSRGPSPRTIIIGSTLPAPISLTRKESLWHFSFTPLLAVLIAIVGGLVIIAFVIIIIMKIRSRQETKKAQTRIKKDDKSHMPLQKDTDDGNDMFHDEEKCPDIIPDVRMAEPIAGGPQTMESSFGGTVKNWEAHYAQHRHDPVNDISFHKNNGEWSSPKSVREKEAVLLTPHHDYVAYTGSSKEYDKSIAEHSLSHLTSFKPLPNTSSL